MNRCSFLVLGGGGGQLGLIRRLKEKGCGVILQDRNPECPGRKFADEFVEADTSDSEAAIRAAAEHRVDGTITAGTDQPVLAATRAAHSRGLPSFLDEDSALAVTDKEVMKKCLIAAEIPTPSCIFAGAGDGADALKDLQGPYVVKPVDSQGQRGVRKFDHSEEFPNHREAALQWSRRRRLIVEEYHRNREITVSGWVKNADLSIWSVTDRVTRDFLPHIGLCLAHRYPSSFAAGRLDDVHRLAERCVRALGITYGPIYFQFLVTDEGILVNETAARLGGAYEEDSLPPICGVDPIDMLIAGTLEPGISPEEASALRPRRAKAFSVPLMFCRPGTVAQVGEPSRLRGLPGVTAMSYLLEAGTVVVPPKNSVQRAAYMVIHGDSPLEVNRLLKRAWPRIEVRDLEGRQLLRNTIGYALIPR